jgi:hypothetical protein
MRLVTHPAPKIAATVVWLLLAPFAWIPAAATRTAALAALDFPLLATLYALTVLLAS